MQNVINIANYFISLSQKEKENDLTNLKLQKILYYSQGEYFKQKQSWLFNEEILAWKLGPVVKEVYEIFSPCGAFPITEFDIKTDVIEIDAATKEFLNEIWKKYNLFSASYLVTKTHKKGGCWDIVFNKNGDNIIRKNLISEKFEPITICNC